MQTQDRSMFSPCKVSGTALCLNRHCVLRTRGDLGNPAEDTAERDQTTDHLRSKNSKGDVSKFASLWVFSFCSASSQPGYKSLHHITLNCFSLLKAWVWLRLVYHWYKSFEGWDMYKLKGSISKGHCFREENYLRQHTDTRILNARAAHQVSYVLYNSSASKTWKLHALLWKVPLL